VADENASEADSEDEAPVLELIAMIQRECGFLRITRKDVHEEVSPSRRQRGVIKSVVWFCRGLPWAKRAKWLKPLMLSVGAVLKMKGCTIRLQAGELCVQLPGASSPDCNFIRLDFLREGHGSKYEARWLCD
jgi:hypothetical protein